MARPFSGNVKLMEKKKGNKLVQIKAAEGRKQQVKLIEARNASPLSSVD